MRLLPQVRVSWSLHLAAGLAAVIAAGSGCDGTLSARDLELDETVARESLHAFLQAWKEGTSAEMLEERSPAIIGTDDQWQRGGKLVDFQILNDDFSDGTNLHLAVELQLADGRRGRPRKSLVRYVVGTSPVVTVFRQ